MDINLDGNTLTAGYAELETVATDRVGRTTSGIYIDLTSGDIVDVDQGFSLGNLRIGMADGTGGPGIDWVNRILYSDAVQRVILYNDGQLNDNSGLISLDWFLRLLYDAAGSQSLDYSNRDLKGSWTKNSQPVVAAANGTAAPSTTPGYIGEMFIDTTHKKVYVATGTSSSSDWTILN